MFYTKNLDKVADQLHYTHKIRNMRLSDRMRYFESENNCYTWAEGLTETTFNDVLYKKLLGLLPRNVRKTLKKLDKEIKKLENDIKSTTGWELYDRNVMYSYHSLQGHASGKASMGIISRPFSPQTASAGRGSSDKSR